MKMRISSLIPLCCHGNCFFSVSLFFFSGILWQKKCFASLAAHSQNNSVELLKAGTGPTSASGAAFSISSFPRLQELILAFLLTASLEENPKYLQSPGSAGFYPAFPVTLQSHLGSEQCLFLGLGFALAAPLHQLGTKTPQCGSERLSKALITWDIFGASIFNARC